MFEIYIQFVVPQFFKLMRLYELISVPPGSVENQSNQSVLLILTTIRCNYLLPEHPSGDMK
jgi:hypothetical protein